MQTIKIFQLEGKDYFTESEAAHYLGISEPKFREIRKEYCIEPIRSFGKNLYRRADMRRLIEQQSAEQDKDYLD